MLYSVLATIVQCDSSNRVVVIDKLGTYVEQTYGAHTNAQDFLGYR